MNAKTRGNYPILASICPECGIVHKRDGLYCRDCADKRKQEVENEIIKTISHTVNT